MQLFDSKFSADDRERLARSRSWLLHQDLVERACLLLCELDPEGCCSPENPHAATEHLHEVQRLVDLLPSLQTPAHVESALMRIFVEMFNEESAAYDWGGVAQLLWTDIRQAQEELP